MPAAGRVDGDLCIDGVGLLVLDGAADWEPDGESDDGESRAGSEHDSECEPHGAECKPDAGADSERGDVVSDDEPECSSDVRAYCRADDAPHGTDGVSFTRADEGRRDVAADDEPDGAHSEPDAGANGERRDVAADDEPQHESHMRYELRQLSQKRGINGNMLLIWVELCMLDCAADSHAHSKPYDRGADVRSDHTESDCTDCQPYDRAHGASYQAPSQSRPITIRITIRMHVQSVCT